MSYPTFGAAVRQAKAYSQFYNAAFMVIVKNGTLDVCPDDPSYEGDKRVYVRNREQAQPGLTWVRAHEVLNGDIVHRNNLSAKTPEKFQVTRIERSPANRILLWPPWYKSGGSRTDCETCEQDQWVLIDTRKEP